MSEMLTEVRFWAQVIGDAKRTIICDPDLESRIKAWIDARGMGGILAVSPSPYVPRNTILILSDANSPLAHALPSADQCGRGVACQWINCPIHASADTPCEVTP